MPDSQVPVVLITGAAQRLGAAMARYFHQREYRVAIHYRQSAAAAMALEQELCGLRPNSALALQAELGEPEALQAMSQQLLEHWGQLDVLINNASSFFPTPVGAVDSEQWDNLFDSNLKGPFFLSQACLPALRNSGGCIINIVDIYGQRPLAEHPVYCAAKAGLAMLTQSLALELSPSVRVNGIAPGAILWPADDSGFSPQAKQALLKKIPQGRLGEDQDIARTAWFLANDAPYINGQVLAVDGGRSVAMD